MVGYENLWNQTEARRQVGTFERPLTIVYNNRNYWLFGLCPSSGIVKNTTSRKLDVFPPSGEGVGDTYSVGPHRKS
jgi:hypothetical protein